MRVHPTAVVSEQAVLDRDVSVGPYAIIEADTQIGESCRIRAHAVVRRYCVIGPQNQIYEGAVLGGEPQDLGFAECRSYLRIGANNRFRECVTIHRGTEPDSATVVGSDCFVMTCAHIGHNSELGNHVIIASNVALAGHVHIADRAFISGGVVIHQFCRVGQLAMIGGNSKIVQDCLPFVVTDGVPGRACGLNMIGLRRAGAGDEDVSALKLGYRILLRSGMKLETALDRLTEIGNPLVDHLAGFARDSARGFCHAAR
ncbi:MAG TPA: acyl-ACP--UDP-N-acetylglucosamine O-acyltransferase [Blastocatellia bacterium]|nr:acyl-ACP--UDP-N-acetylglucosamine O-acyltransferase [Blastocatellia bacterium]